MRKHILRATRTPNSLVENNYQNFYVELHVQFAESLTPQQTVGVRLYDENYHLYGIDTQWFNNGQKVRNALFTFSDYNHRISNVFYAFVYVDDHFKWMSEIRFDTAVATECHATLEECHNFTDDYFFATTLAKTNWWMEMDLYPYTKEFIKEMTSRLRHYRNMQTSREWPKLPAILVSGQAYYADHIASEILTHFLAGYEYLTISLKDLLTREEEDRIDWIEGLKAHRCVWVKIPRIDFSDRSNLVWVERFLDQVQRFDAYPNTVFVFSGSQASVDNLLQHYSSRETLFLSSMCINVTMKQLAYKGAEYEYWNSRANLEDYSSEDDSFKDSFSEFASLDEDKSRTETLMKSFEVVAAEYEEYRYHDGVYHTDEEEVMEEVRWARRNEGIGNILTSLQNKERSKEAATTANTAQQRLNSLIGLTRVKEEIDSARTLALFSKMRRQMSLFTRTDERHHMLFLGNPGTGKTTVAKLIGEMYHEIGLLSKGQTVETSRTKLVGEYIGQTEARTKEAIEQARGGVLFIDEAYTLINSHEDDNKDYGREILHALLPVLSEPNSDMIVILAGYEDKMEFMLRSNPGLQDRFPLTIHFEDYTAEELLDIARLICRENNFRLTPEADERLRQLMRETISRKDVNFGNGRWVHNLMEHGVIKCMAKRVMEKAASTTMQRALYNHEDLELFTYITSSDVEAAAFQMTLSAESHSTSRRPIGFLAMGA